MLLIQQDNQHFRVFGNGTAAPFDGGFDNAISLIIFWRKENMRAKQLRFIDNAHDGDTP
jgi:hypothetical protein